MCKVTLLQTVEHLPATWIVATCTTALPGCHQKRVVEFGEWLCSHVLRKVPHRYVVFTIPRILRRYFLYDRNLLSHLSRCAWESLKLFLQKAVPEKNPIPGKSETSTNS
jgi:hypothetical protein